MNNQLLNVNPYNLGDFNNGEYMLATESIYEKLGLGKNPSESELVACAKQLIELSEAYYYKLHGHISMRECFRRMTTIDENNLEAIIHREACLDNLFKSKNTKRQKRKNVYVLKARDLYKIGYSVNTERRVQELMTGCPFPIEIMFSIPSKSASTVERLLHRMYRDYRTAGEWFRLPPYTVKKIKLFIEDYNKEDILEEAFEDLLT